MPKKEGYLGESAARRRMEEFHGKHNVIKTQGSQNVPDFLILDTRSAIEVKRTSKKKFYPTQHDRDQWHMLQEWEHETNWKTHYWILVKKAFKYDIEQLTLIEFGEKYLGIVPLNRTHLICRECKERLETPECERRLKTNTYTECPHYRAARRKQ